MPRQRPGGAVRVSSGHAAKPFVVNTCQSGRLARIHSRSRVELKVPAAVVIRPGARVGAIVIDASAMMEFLWQTPLGSRVEARLLRAGDEFPAPHLLDVEVVQARRRLVRAGDVLPGRAEEALEDLASFDIRRHSHFDSLGRAWELRVNLTGYDAMYVALAEATEAPLVTCDGPLGATPVHAARIEVIR